MLIDVGNQIVRVKRWLFCSFSKSLFEFFTDTGLYPTVAMAWCPYFVQDYCLSVNSSNNLLHPNKLIASSFMAYSIYLHTAKIISHLICLIRPVPKPLIQ